MSYFDIVFIQTVAAFVTLGITAITVGTVVYLTGKWGEKEENG